MMCFRFDICSVPLFFYYCYYHYCCSLSLLCAYFLVFFSQSCVAGKRRIKKNRTRNLYVKRPNKHAEFRECNGKRVQKMGGKSVQHIHWQHTPRHTQWWRQRRLPLRRQQWRLYAIIFTQSLLLCTACN